MIRLIGVVEREALASISKTETFHIDEGETRAYMIELLLSVCVCGYVNV